MCSNRIHRAWSTIWVLAAVLGVSSCCAHRFDQPKQPLTSGPAEGTLARDGQALVDRAKAYAAKTLSIAYTTRMEHYGPEGAIKGRVEILAKRPGKLRFEGLTPSDDTVAVLISNGERFMSHERGQAVCYVGPACSANVSRLVPLPFDGKRLFDLLVGGAPLLEGAEAQGRWNECEGVYELVLVRGPLTETIWLRPDVFAPVRVLMSRSGEEQFRIEYEDFKEIDGVLQPQQMRYVSERAGVDLTMEIRDAERNGIDQEGRLFAPECPAGTERRELPCR